MYRLNFWSYLDVDFCMAASSREKQRAVQLRLKGVAVTKIAKILGRSKGTVWNWLRHVPVTPAQRRALLERSNIKGIAARAHEEALSNRRLWRAEAAEQWTKLQNDSFFLLGLGLYWGEGHKTSGRLELSNSDPELLKVWAAWCGRFLTDCELTASVMIHSDTDSKQALLFWETTLRLSVKVYWHSKRTKIDNKFFHKKLPYGTARVSVTRSIRHFIKVMEWLKLASQTVWPSTSG